MGTDRHWTRSNPALLIVQSTRLHPALWLCAARNDALRARSRHCPSDDLRAVTACVIARLRRTRPVLTPLPSSATEAMAKVLVPRESGPNHIAPVFSLR